MHHRAAGQSTIKWFRSASRPGSRPPAAGAPSPKDQDHTRQHQQPVGERLSIPSPRSAGTARGGRLRWAPLASSWRTTPGDAAGASAKNLRKLRSGSLPRCAGAAGSADDLNLHKHASRRRACPRGVASSWASAARTASHRRSSRPPAAPAPRPGPRGRRPRTPAPASDEPHPGPVRGEHSIRLPGELCWSKTGLSDPGGPGGEVSLIRAPAQPFSATVRAMPSSSRSCWVAATSSAGVLRGPRRIDRSVRVPCAPRATGPWLAVSMAASLPPAARPRRASLLDGPDTPGLQPSWVSLSTVTRRPWRQSRAAGNTREPGTGTVEWHRARFPLPDCVLRAPIPRGFPPEPRSAGHVDHARPLLLRRAAPPRTVRNDPGPLRRRVYAPGTPHVHPHVNRHVVPARPTARPHRPHDERDSSWASAPSLTTAAAARRPPLCRRALTAGAGAQAGSVLTTQAASPARRRSR